VLIRRGSLAARMATALRQRIISGEIGAGSILRQDRIAEEFGASRMPVREALQSLQQDGFVVIEPNRGARVAPLDPEDVREIYEMRIAAETLALRLAIPEVGDRQLDRAHAIQEQAERAPPNAAAHTDANRDFHFALYEPSGRPRLLAHIRGLADLADRYLRVAFVALDYVERSDAEHRGILDACRRRDADEACARLADHIEGAGRALVAELQRPSA